MTSHKKTIILVLFLRIILPATVVADSDTLKGTYSLMKGMQAVESSVLHLPFISGVSIRASWEALEPARGEFDWRYIDNALREVKKANKKAMLRVLPGIHSPQWVYSRGIRIFEMKDLKRRSNDFGKIRKTPLPWDEVYLSEWIRFVDALGRRYGSDDTVILVHMAGPTINSAEMHLPKRGEARQKILDAGYSKEKLVKAWRKVIDAYSVAFSGRALALNIAVPLMRDGSLEEIIRYGLSKVGKRLCIQGNWLTGHTNQRYYPYELMTRLKKEDNVTIGFQMLAAAAWKKRRQGSLEESVQKGLDAGAQYFEIYEMDILENRNRQLLEKLDKKLR